MIPLHLSRPLARLLICGDSKTCGQNPDLDREWLRDAWDKDGLHSVVAMKISTCQDKCAHASVARIITDQGAEWYGQLQKEHYDALVAWAQSCKAAGALTERPAVLVQTAFTA